MPNKNTKTETLKHIETELEAALENCACLGRDAYGDYITKCKNGLMLEIRKLL